MELIAGSLHLTLSALGRIDEEDWCRVAVDVSDSGFSANFVAFLQGRDIESFAEGVAVMWGEVGSPKEAVLRCHEPGIFLKLSSDKHGHIRGEYKFEREAQGEFSPVLCGIVDMDQSYLTALANACRRFLADLGK